MVCIEDITISINLKESCYHTLVSWPKEDSESPPHFSPKSTFYVVQLPAMAIFPELAPIWAYMFHLMKQITRVRNHSKILLPVSKGIILNMWDTPMELPPFTKLSVSCELYNTCICNFLPLAISDLYWMDTGDYLLCTTHTHAITSFFFFNLQDSSIGEMAVRNELNYFIWGI